MGNMLRVLGGHLTNSDDIYSLYLKSIYMQLG